MIKVKGLLNESSQLVSYKDLYNGIAANNGCYCIAIDLNVISKTASPFQFTMPGNLRLTAKNSSLTFFDEKNTRNYFRFGEEDVAQSIKVVKLPYGSALLIPLKNGLTCTFTIPKFEL